MKYIDYLDEFYFLFWVNLICFTLHSFCFGLIKINFKFFFAFEEQKKKKQ